MDLYTQTEKIMDTDDNDNWDEMRMSIYDEDFIDEDLTTLVQICKYVPDRKLQKFVEFLDDKFDSLAGITSFTTLLADAVKRDDVETLKLLVKIRHFDNLDSCCLLGQTLLLLSSRRGSSKCMAVLLARGVDFNFDGKDLLLSCGHSHSMAVNLFKFSGSYCDIIKTPMMHAIQANSMECVEMLLDYGYRINSMNSHGVTALAFACTLGNHKIGNVLIKHGADVDAGTPIIYAVQKNSRKCLMMLLENGAYIDIRNLDGDTALMCSCWNGFERIVDMLLRYGADVNVQNNRGLTAVIHAIQGNFIGCLHKLLTQDTNVELISSRGAVLIHALQGNGNTMEMLLTSGKLFGDGRLKPVAKENISMHLMKKPFSVKSVWLTIQFDLFKWSWCYPIPRFFERYVFAALLCGICPENVRYKEFYISPLLMAFLAKKPSIIKYLLANLYFFPEDYKVLSSDNTTKYMIPFKDETKALLDQLTLQPLSLQTWSFLVISKSISISGPPCDRASRVESLPLPEFMKRRLTFKSEVSQLCCTHWDAIENRRPGDLIFGRRNTGMDFRDKQCLSGCAICGDESGPSWDTLYQRYSSTARPEFLPARNV